VSVPVSVCLCVYVFKSVCLRVCVFACRCVDVSMCRCVSVSVCLYVFVSMCLCLRLCVCVYMRMCLCACVMIWVIVRVRVFMYARVGGGGEEVEGCVCVRVCVFVHVCVRVISQHKKDSCPGSIRRIGVSHLSHICMFHVTFVCFMSRTSLSHFAHMNESWQRVQKMWHQD